MRAHKLAAERERQAEMELLAADPFDIEAQAKIAERIRQAQVRHSPLFAGFFVVGALCVVHVMMGLSYSMARPSI